MLFGFVRGIRTAELDAIQHEDATTPSPPCSARLASFLAVGSLTTVVRISGRSMFNHQGVRVVAGQAGERDPEEKYYISKLSKENHRPQ